MSRLRAVICISYAMSSLALSACGSDSTTAPGPAPTIEATTFASSLNVDLAASTKTTGGMYYRDLVTGSGAVVASGQALTAHYTGWFTNGTQFDSNGPTDTPIPFTLGVRQVIDGWDIGIVGMRVGGQRQLIIPPSLAYGPYDYLGIPGNSILVFSITIVSAK
jgi:FKBP-type peptidyl-prolyl cis-trans isomerase FkpA